MAQHFTTKVIWATLLFFVVVIALALTNPSLNALVTNRTLLNRTPARVAEYAFVRGIVSHTNVLRDLRGRPIELLLTIHRPQVVNASSTLIDAPEEVAVSVTQRTLLQEENGQGLTIEDIHAGDQVIVEGRYVLKERKVIFTASVSRLRAR